MEPRWYDIPMEELRRALGEYVRRTPLRRLAEHIGLSPHALRRFLDGTGLPQDRIRRKVTGWYLWSRLDHRPPPAVYEEPPGKADDLPLEQVREAAYEVARRTSVRQLAREVGMSPTGLSGFLSGEKRPTSRTRWKLAQWYLRSQGA